MSQDELQATVVNIEDHVVGLKTKQVALYAWGLVVATVFVCGVYYGIKEQFKDMIVRMDRMEARINAKIDTVSRRQRDDKRDMEVKINNFQPAAVVLPAPVQSASKTNYYTERLVNGHIVLTRIAANTR